MRKTSFIKTGFLPDATFGVVRGLPFFLLEKIGTKAVMLNTFHLWRQKMVSIAERFGSIKEVIGWKGKVATDSGGWQVLSLIEKGKGKITERGLEFWLDDKKYTFTPQKSIQTQFVLGSDLMIVLDDCPPPLAAKERLVKAVTRTVEFARISKEEFWKQIEKRGMKTRPLLLAPIQGGNILSLREKCFQQLEEIGFDGYGLGGWFLDKKGRPQEKVINFVGSLIPKNKIAFALGVGDPWSVVISYRAGFKLFDCVIPTREARHGRLYIFERDPSSLSFDHPGFYKFVYISRGRYRYDPSPLSPYCSCFTCQTTSLAYLHYLFKIKDPSFIVLAVIHNLTFYNTLISLLQK